MAGFWFPLDTHLNVTFHIKICVLWASVKCCPTTLFPKSANLPKVLWKHTFTVFV